MAPLLIVVASPLIQVGLSLRQRSIELLAKRNTIKFIEHGLMQPFDDPVGLRTLPLGAGMINVFDRSRQLILMAIRTPAIRRAPIRQNPTERHLRLLKERHDLIIEQLGRG